MRRIFWFLFAFISFLLIFQVVRANTSVILKIDELMLRIEPIKEKFLAAVNYTNSSDSWFKLTSKIGCGMDPWEKECTGLNNLGPNSRHEYCLKQYLANKVIVFSDIYIETIPSGTPICMACGCEIPETYIKTSTNNALFLTNLGFSTSSAPTQRNTEQESTTTTTTTTTITTTNSLLTDNMRACSKDMDCMLANETRCSCYYGGTRIAVNRSNYINYIRSTRTNTIQCKLNNICIKEYGTYPKCEDNLCVKKVRSYCGVKDGVLKDYATMADLVTDKGKYQTIANRFLTCQELREYFKKYNNFKGYNYMFGIYGSAIAKENGK